VAPLLQSVSNVVQVDLICGEVGAAREPGQRRDGVGPGLGRSPLRDRSRQSPIARTLQDLSPGSSHRRRQLSFGGEDWDTDEDEPSNRGAVAAELRSATVRLQRHTLRTVQFPSDVHGNAGRCGELTAAPTSSAPVVDQANTSECRNKGSFREAEVSPKRRLQNPGSTTIIDSGGSLSTLQHMHNLIMTLNPQEREVFMRSHNFVAELGAVAMVSVGHNKLQRWSA
jgi:hypothetical protein